MARKPRISLIWEIVADAHVAMVTTQFKSGLHSRPLEPRADRRRGVIWFLTDEDSTKISEIKKSHAVCLNFMDDKARIYLSIAGRAYIKQDSQQAAKIWRASDSVWWPDAADDPRVRVIRVEPHIAELWDGPSNWAVVAFEFAKARLTGDRPNLGENRKSVIRMRGTSKSR